ncbi:2Fe-2S iron-sulfur cluster-binding protein [Pseudoduganella sp. RAF53_2]|uniref:2Fe-2S iron-sulfur cluster-binding protein n=1 Tax=unclassified Pseudoduganella TaxID=2637179 RepID=UPI003F99AC9C
MFKVAVEPRGLSFETDEESTLLISALRAGLTMPHSCRNGTCRTCICKLRSGSVHYRIEWPGLSFDEKNDGYILPCVAYADSDLVLDAPAARLVR